MNVVSSDSLLESGLELLKEILFSSKLAFRTYKYIYIQMVNLFRVI